MLQNSTISSGVPGSWPAKSLEGKPSTVNPLSANRCCTASSASYCGVSPHLEATLTTRRTWP